MTINSIIIQSSNGDTKDKSILNLHPGNNQIHVQDTECVIYNIARKIVTPKLCPLLLG